MCRRTLCLGNSENLTSQTAEEDKLEEAVLAGAKGALLSAGHEACRQDAAAICRPSPPRHNTVRFGYVTSLSVRIRHMRATETRRKRKVTLSVV